MSTRIYVFYWFVFLLLAPFFLKAQSRRDTIIIPANAFEAGEELHFDIKYGIVKGAKAIMRVDLEPHGYGYVYHSKMQVLTVGAVDKIYWVDYVFESYFDIYTGLPVMAIRNIHEKSHKVYNEARFDHDKNIVYSTNTGLRKVPDNIMDVVSAFYYARTYLFKDLEKEEVITLTSFFEDRVFQFGIRFKGYETLRTPLGKVETLHFTSIIDDKKFKKENDLQIWFSNDGNYVPVRLEADIPLGSIKMNLVEYKGLRNVFLTK